MGGRVDAVGLTGERYGGIVVRFRGCGTDFVNVAAALEAMDCGLGDVLIRRTTSISITLAQQSPPGLVDAQVE